MKKLTKLFSVLLAVVLLLSMAVTASAATITAPTDDDHEYVAYQIFVGDYDTATGKLSNVKFGADSNQSGEVPQAVLDSLAAETDEAAILAIINTYADLSGDGISLTAGEAVTVASGYYLIKDVAGTVTGNETYTTYIMKVVGAETFNPKRDNAPELTKTVDDVNDSDGTTETGKTTADYDIGDTVPFTVTAELPGNVSAYHGPYKLVFTDTMDDGLTLNAGSVVVKVNGTAITLPGEAIATTDHGLTVTIGDVKDYGGTDGSIVVLTYTAQLNEDAVVGGSGNVNTVKLQFSNDPNYDGTGEDTPTGETPPEKTVVFTYKTVVDKVDDAGAALAGAGFTLYKMYAKVADVPAGADPCTESGYTVDAETGTGYYKVERINAGEQAQFTFSGLDDGEYLLVETETPAGYNTLKPVTFTISASTDGDGKIVLEATSTLQDAFQGTSNGSGEVHATIENKAGSLLPSTGGIGTTIFYIAGAVLVLGAGITLVVKKRAGAK